MKRALIDAAKRGFFAAGIEVARATPSTDSRRLALIRDFRIQTVIDVGANEGQYGCDLRKVGYRSTIISFEPVAAVYEKLIEAAAADPAWSALKLGLADAAGDATINVGGSTAISSLFAMNERLRQALPSSAVVATETIEVARLDEIREVQSARGPIMLKVDVQGAELLVLAGASGILEHVVLIELELSMRELYRGQPLFTAVVDALSQAGFDLMALEPGFRDTVTGEYLQFDGFFTRSPNGQPASG